MPRKLLKYSPVINRATFQLKYNWSWHSGYSDNVEGWIPPATGSSKNTVTQFRSKQYFTVEVDYGDGTVEQYRSVYNKSTSGYGDYLVCFRHFMTEIEDNATQKFSYDTVAPHHYEDDDKSVLRTIVMTFSAPIIYINHEYSHLSSFPVFEFPELIYLKVSTPSNNVGEMPFDTFARIPKLEHFLLETISVDNTVIPESLWTMTKLKELSIRRVFKKATDLEGSGIRNINKLVNLEVLYYTGPLAGIYIKELNDLSKLYSLNWVCDNNAGGYIGGINKAPVMDEVSQINPRLTGFGYISGFESDYQRTAWPYHLSGYGWENIRSINMYCSRDVVLDPLPEYWHEYRNATSIIIYESLGTQQRADDFVDLFYDFVTNWEQITMSQTAKDGKRNQWYNFTVAYLDPVGNSPNRIPSGLYIEPEGFVEGVSNGNPKTPMEKIYVLMKNYKQKWITFDKPTS